MRGFLIRYAASIAALLLLNGRIEDFHLSGVGAAALAVIILAVGNLMVRPMAKAISAAGCLVNALTFGLFEWLILLVFWVLTFYAVGWLEVVGGFQVDSFKAAVIGALSLSLVNAAVSVLVGRDDKQQRRDEERR